MIQTFEKAIPAAFNNVFQKSLSEITRDEFLKATKPATGKDIREKLEDERVFKIEKR